MFKFIDGRYVYCVGYDPDKTKLLVIYKSGHARKHQAITYSDVSQQEFDNFIKDEKLEFLDKNQVFTTKPMSTSDFFGF